PAGSEEYQREYSHKIWDFFYNRTKINKEGYIDNVNGLPTVLSTSPALAPGDIYNITTIGIHPIFGIPITVSFRVIVLAVVQQYPFSLQSGFPAMLVTPDLAPNILSFSLYPRPIKYLVSTNEDFREGRNVEITEKIETFFNANDSVLISQENDFVAASAHSVWEDMLEIIDFQVKTFDFMQYFVGFGLVVGAMGMIIIAMRNVAERRREIGMMRAIGYKKRQIIVSVILELSIIAGLGLIMGLINGIFLGWSFARLYDWFVMLSATRLLLYTGIMLGIALLASIIPGIRANRITPAEALRYVG
ncbi:MAG: ABC transporter permease, partial [Candidatus Heimdallarchaeaceae archaeon]